MPNSQESNQLNIDQVNILSLNRTPLTKEEIFLYSSKLSETQCSIWAVNSIYLKKISQKVAGSLFILLSNKINLQRSEASVVWTWSCSALLERTSIHIERFSLISEKMPVYAKKGFSREIRKFCRSINRVTLVTN